MKKYQLFVWLRAVSKVALLKQLELVKQAALAFGLPAMVIGPGFYGFFTICCLL